MATAGKALCRRNGTQEKILNVILKRGKVIKIAFCNRSNCFTHKGGDTIQMMLTKKHLEQMHDVSVDICLDPGDLDKCHYDIVHIFNIQTFAQSAAFAEKAKQHKIKIVLTPIYWDLGYVISLTALTKLRLFSVLPAYQCLKTPVIYASSKTSARRYLSEFYVRSVDTILNRADIVLPNSPEESDIIKKHFHVGPQLKAAIVPNAIEYANLPSQEQQAKDQDMVLLVGRISVAKNQITFLRAMMDKPHLALYFIGSIEDHAYYKQLNSLAKKRGNVFFIDEISQEELAAYYKKAYLHVLPSFRESPGLVSLEAFLYGCEIVTSGENFTPVAYYRFGEIGHLCNPYSKASISIAVEHAYRHPKQNLTNRQDYFDFFNYRTVAKLTHEAYSRLLSDS